MNPDRRKRKRRRIPAAFLALVMILGLLGGTEAFATSIDTSTYNQTDSLNNYYYVYSTTLPSTVSWTGESTDISYASWKVAGGNNGDNIITTSTITITGSGTLTLSGDTTANIEIGSSESGASSINVVIDLAGHTLTGTGQSIYSVANSDGSYSTDDKRAYYRSVVTIESNASVTLKDSASGGTITGGYGDYISSGSSGHYYGGGVCINGGSLTMTGGTISNNVATTDTYGGGVCLYSGSFTMSGGTISGNGVASSSTAGGGVYVNGGTFTLSGGTISGNKCGNSGGAGISINESASFTMTGGTVSNNEGTKNAGGILINSTGTNTISGGTISNNTAGQNGGGIMVRESASLTLSGGTISGNTAADTLSGKSGGNGGGIYVDHKATLTMTGGTITENSAKDGSANGTGVGGGICADEEDSTGSTLSVTGGTIANNSADGNAADVYISTNSSAAMSLSALNDGVYYGSTGYLISGWFEDGSSARYESTSSPSEVTAISSSTEYSLIAASACYKSSSHTWDSGTVTKEATSDEEGVFTYTCTVCGETKTEAISCIGEVTAEASVSDSAPEVTADVDEDALADALLTETEQAAVEAGGEAVFSLVVTTDEDETVDEDDIDLADELAEEKGLIIGKYLDISLYLTVKDANGNVITDGRRITDTNGVAYTISITIPEELLSDGRTYYLIHVHDGQPEVIATTTSGTFEFTTTEFSTYAIAYTEGSSAAETGDSANMALWFALAACAVLLCAASVKRILR